MHSLFIICNFLGTFEHNSLPALVLAAGLQWKVDLTMYPVHFGHLGLNHSKWYTLAQGYSLILC